MSKTIGRNDLCWCGSGKKYKKCHINREVKSYEVHNNFKNSLKYKTCKVPTALQHECTDTIIKAHTISKSANLKHIARDGKVYGMSIDMLTIKEKFKPIELKLIHINQASVFYIFCSKHDKEIFAPLEDKKFIFLDEQIFLLAYRIVSKAIYLKEQQIQLYDEKVRYYDDGETNLFQFQANNFSDKDSQLRDIKNIKEIFDNDLLANDYNSIKHYSIIFDKVPEIMVSGAFIPDVDFQGNILIDYINNYDKEYNAIFTSTIKLDENKGAIIFSWNDNVKSDECEEFIGSLDSLCNEDKVKAITCFLFKRNNENLYLSPEWYDSLTLENKEFILSCYALDKEVPFSQELVEELIGLNILQDSFKNLDVILQKQVLNTLPFSDDDISKFEEYDFFDWNIIEVKTNLDLEKIDD